jgi:hypothetical protein
MSQQPDEIIVNPSRSSDRQAFVAAARQGTGAVLRTRLIGQKGAERRENVGMTDAARRRLIIALGGTPNP